MERQLLQGDLTPHQVSSGSPDSAGRLDGRAHGRKHGRESQSLEMGQEVRDTGAQSPETRLGPPAQARSCLGGDEPVKGETIWTK